MKRMAVAALLAVAGSAAAAEVVKSATFAGEISRRAAKPLEDGTRMFQVYVSVTTTAGAVPGQGQIAAAGRFAVAAGCRNGTAMSAIYAGSTAEAAEFEVLCGVR